MKRTYQQEQRKHPKSPLGFRARMKTVGGRKVF